jgi:hypothetical protein
MPTAALRLRCQIHAHFGTPEAKPPPQTDQNKTTNLTADDAAGRK